MKDKTVFFCTECGMESPKWLGKCPSCGNWNTFSEQPKQQKSKPASIASRNPSVYKKLSELNTENETRFKTGTGELDRVLGGGAVRGSLVLFGGAPGIGKSTLLLQICNYLAKRQKVLYVTGEESERQLKMRAERLGVDADGLYVFAETGLDEITECAGKLLPDLMIVDSIQTLCKSGLDSIPGNVGQVKECTFTLMQLAKNCNMTVFVIGHVNKDGAIAGPKVLEHMVDCVLYFEGDRNMPYRILRAEKNRFGSTNEIGVFEMRESGLTEVPNPSETLLSGRPDNVPGTCVACVMEGARPILAEIQALVTQTSFGVPRRMCSGVDYNRAMLLIAVLEKRAGFFIGNCDAYINVVGGLNLSEPAADLPALLAIASSFRDKNIGAGVAAFGEIGLTGELRAVSFAENRLWEISRLGFKKCILPKQNADKLRIPDGIELVRAENIRQAIDSASM